MEKNSLVHSLKDTKVQALKTLLLQYMEEGRDLGSEPRSSMLLNTLHACSMSYHHLASIEEYGLARLHR